jgi:hypothetical protein
VNSTLIPCPLCDALPFDDAIELANHLDTACAGRGTAPAGTHAAPPLPPPAPPLAPETTIRSFSPGGTRAQASRPAKPCTDKQASFIRSLVDRKGATAPDYDALSSRDASALIDSLLVLPDAARAGTAAGTTTGPAAEGFHIFDGAIFKVQVSKTGNRYAKQLDEDHAWNYAGAAPLRNLSEATKATLQDAQAYGLKFGICMCCGATLTDPNSIAAGIGPICATKF